MDLGVGACIWQQWDTGWFYGEVQYRCSGGGGGSSSSSSSSSSGAPSSSGRFVVLFSDGEACEVDLRAQHRAGLLRLATAREIKASVLRHKGGGRACEHCDREFLSAHGVRLHAARCEKRSRGGAAAWQEVVASPIASGGGGRHRAVHNRSTRAWEVQPSVPAAAGGGSLRHCH